MKKLVVALSLCGLLGACDQGTSFNIPQNKDLKDGGVFVSYNFGCEKGCDQIEKGDLITSVDGKTVKTAEEIDAMNLADGKPHKLVLMARGSHDQT